MPIRAHGLRWSLMSLILTSFSWTYALLQVPGGWLAERFSPRRTLFVHRRRRWRTHKAASRIGSAGASEGNRTLVYSFGSCLVAFSWFVTAHRRAEKYQQIRRFCAVWCRIAARHHPLPHPRFLSLF
jgi:MFS family permease